MTKLSIVVCTYNRQKYIIKTLNHLADQTSASNAFEVICVNNNSTDQTDQLITAYLNKNNPENFKYFIEKNQGHTYARNRGIQESQGDLIAFIDDDAFVEPHFAQNIIEYFTRHPKVMAIGGKINPVYEESAPKWMSKFLLPLVAAIDMGDHPKPFKGTKFPIGANMCFRKIVFEKYGLFNLELGRRGTGLEGGDEKDFFIRMKANKEPIHYVPQVCVNHVIPQKRVENNYIKGLAIGVGTSEKTRLKDQSIKKKANKVFEELFKMAATVILSLAYAATFQFEKAKMLVLFRYWVTLGFLQK